VGSWVTIGDIFVIWKVEIARRTEFFEIYERSVGDGEMVTAPHAPHLEGPVDPPDDHSLRENRS
jgi:hypothetical protein